MAERPTPPPESKNPCSLITYKGFLFREHRKVHSFLGYLKSSRLTYPYYKVSEERERVKG